jgi:hypothetical protein
VCWLSPGSDGVQLNILLGLTVQYSRGEPLGQRCGHVDSGFGFGLSLLAGVGVASVPGLALPQQVKHLDDAIDTGSSSCAGVLDAQFPIERLDCEDH